MKDNQIKDKKKRLIVINAVVLLTTLVYVQPCLSENQGGKQSQKVKTEHAASKKGVTKPESKPLRSQNLKIGKSLVESEGCLDCHRIAGGGLKDGISLDGIGAKRSARFIRNQLSDPEAHVEKNKAAFDGDPNLMPKPNLSRKQIAAIVEYLLSLKKTQ